MISNEKLVDVVSVEDSAPANTKLPVKVSPFHTAASGVWPALSPGLTEDGLGAC